MLVSKVAGTENVSDRFSGIWRRTCPNLASTLTLIPTLTLNLTLRATSLYNAGCWERSHLPSFNSMLTTLPCMYVCEVSPPTSDPNTYPSSKLKLKSNFNPNPNPHPNGRIRLQGTGEIVRREFRNFSYKQDKFRKHEVTDCFLSSHDHIVLCVYSWS